MKRIVLLFGLLLSLAATAQDYEADWNKVLDFEADGIVKRAAEETEKICLMAKKDGNEPQIIKTFFFRAKYMQVLEEDAQAKIIASLRAEKETMSVPARAIMESLYGQLLNTLYRNNSWRIGERTPIADAQPTDDIALWGKKEYENAITQAYEKSIAQREVLYTTPLENYEAVIEMDIRLKATKRSLYDFLMTEYIDYIQRKSYLRVYESNTQQLYEDTAEFLKYEYNGENTDARLVISLYQELERLYRSKNDTYSLQRAILRRLDFATNYSFNFAHAEIYRKTLEHYDRVWEGPFAYEARLDLARRYVADADKKKNPDFLLKALELCDGILRNSREAACAEKALLLRHNLMEQSIGITAESVATPGKPILALIEFQNLSSVRVRIFRVPAGGGPYYGFDPKEVKGREMVADTIYALPVRTDLFRYSTEILLPSLPTGTYLVDVLPEGEVTKADHAVIGIQVTHMAVTEQRQGSANVYQVVNRLSGKPMKKVTGFTPSAEGYTDKRGRLAFESDNSTDYQDLYFVHKQDTVSASFYNSYRSNHSSTDEDEEYFVSTHLFTDRAIYRPGQKMFFKGVVIKEQNGIKSLVKDIYIAVVLEDPSGNEAGSMRVKVNEYGSFTGEFMLPKTGLTGEYTLIAEEDDDYEQDKHTFWDDDNLDFEESELTFSVEEYKRPAFEVTFNEVEKTVRVNETIIAKGKARSFSDSAIGGAKVKYRVERSVTDIYSGHYSKGEAVLATGELLTEVDGTFAIPFTAYPDSTWEKNRKPIFRYDVKVDVTDINGETHSEEQTINAGYHLLNLTVQAPKLIENGNEKVTIDTKTLNGAFAPAKGKITIYKHKQKSKLMKRPWSSPGIQEIPREKFEKLFPFVPYEEERDTVTYEKMVFTADTDTGISKEVALPNFDDWKSGSYVAIYSVTDSVGNALEEKVYFTVRKTGTKMLPEEGVFDFKALNADARKDGYASFELRSPLAAAYINVEAYAHGKNTYGATVVVKDGKAVVKVPIDKKFPAETTITFDLVWQGSIHQDEHLTPSADRPYLKVEATSITNKFLPGSKETWSFTIKGSESLPSEVLASMYDKSLDDFATSSWDSFNYYGRTYPGYSRYVPHKRLLHDETQSDEFSNYRYFPQRDTGDQLKRFGFDINHSRLKLDIEAAANRKRELKVLKDGGMVITGNLSDEEGGLPGATVKVMDTERTATTDMDGNYSIAASSGEVLIFSYVGFDSKSVTIGSEKEINVVLETAILQNVTIDFYTNSRSSSVILGKSGDLAKDMPEDNAVMAASMVKFDVNAPEVYGDELSSQNSLQEVAVGFNYTIEKDPSDDQAILLRGTGSINGNVEPLFIVDGMPIDEDGFRSIRESDIASFNILKDAAATSIYGNRGANGVIIITTKTGLKEEAMALKNIKARKNLNETAFFYPQLLTDKKGNLSFTFTSPEALTQWKLRLFAHDKKAVSGYYESIATTQKDLMVTPNMPRFLREKDTVVITAKVTNLTAEAKTGNAMLQLFDAATMEPIDTAMSNTVPMQPFTIPAKGSTTATWTIAVPSGVQGVQYKVVAKTGNFTDGEENILPVLTNSMLVTESIPLWVKLNTTKEYTLENLKNNTSTTLRHQGITLEYTSNPTWLALQSLPYLMEYEHDCAEQVFSRYYADALATHVMNSNPKIAEVFADWKKEGKPLSKLAQNEELKSVIMAESPWLLDTESDEEQKCRLAALFDLDRMKGTMAANFSKLEDKQSASGGFPWFEGGNDNEYITRHILAGMGHLEKLGAMPAYPNTPGTLIKKGVNYIDGKFMEYHRARQGAAKKEKKFSIINPYSDLHYLYTRSFYLKGYIPDDSLKKAINTHLDMVKDKWLDYSLYEKGMAALVLKRFGDTITSKKVVESLRQTSANNEEWGMYWIANKPGWYWHQAPIETQALLIEAFTEVDNDTVSVDAMKVWLIKQKQNKNWPTTKSTAEAVYALMLQGTDWLSVQDATEIQYGDAVAFAKKTAETGKEAGTGYMKLQWKAEEVDKSLATLEIKNNSQVPGYGGLYWQYFEELDKIPSAQAGLMSVEKELYLKTTTLAGSELKKITAGSPLKIGDLVTVRLVITLKEDAEYVHLKDMRASAFEPVDVLSGYHHQDGLGYYRSTRDAATHFFFDRIAKGTYILEYDVRVNNAGEFSNGITTIQSMYAPEFSGHTKGIRVKTEQ